MSYDVRASDVCVLAMDVLAVQFEEAVVVEAAPQEVQVVGHVALPHPLVLARTLMCALVRLVCK